MLLKKKVYVGLISAIIIPLLISTILFTTSFKNHTIEKLEKTDLPTVLSEIKNSIELELSNPIIVSKEIAKNSFIKEWFSNKESVEKKDSFIKYLSEIQKENKAITSYIISKNTGNYYTNKGISRTINKNNDKWFYDFINSEKEFELSLDVDKTTNEVVVFINYVIEINEKRSGIAGIGLPLSEMTTLISNYRIGEAGIVYLVSEQGEIMIHENKEKIGIDVNLKEIKEQGILNVNIEGEEYATSSIKLKSLDWYLIAEIPHNQLFGTINNAINKNIILGVSIALIGLFFVRILTKQIFQPIEEITKAVKSLTEKDGDLTARLPKMKENEIGDLAKNFNVFLNQIHDMFKQVSDSAIEVKGIADNVQLKIDNASNIAEEQSSNTQTVAAAVNEMEVTVQEISNSAENASNIALITEESTKKGADFVAETIEQMSTLENSMKDSVSSVLELSEEIKSISKVLEVIRGISEQTNLLALNAAIEAARAGEAGRGFAVVADEVRSLASKTSDSTEQINKMIESLNIKADLTVKNIEKGSENTIQSAERLQTIGESFKNISNEIINLTEINTSVAQSTREQTTATTEISENIVMISNSSLETKENMLNSQTLCENLHNESNSLKNLIDKFTI